MSFDKKLGWRLVRKIKEKPHKELSASQIESMLSNVLLIVRSSYLCYFYYSFLLTYLLRAHLLACCLQIWQRLKHRVCKKCYYTFKDSIAYERLICLADAGVLLCERKAAGTTNLCNNVVSEAAVRVLRKLVCCACRKRDLSDELAEIKRRRASKQAGALFDCE